MRLALDRILSSKAAPAPHEVKPAMYRAIARVNGAIRRGVLPHPKNYPCADCGQPAGYYDHRDYLKPLEVSPVCNVCNQMRGPGLNATSLARCLHVQPVVVTTPHGEAIGFGLCASKAVLRDELPRKKMKVGKLTEAQVRHVLASTDTDRSLARQFAVSDFCIYAIRRGLSWKHIERPGLALRSI